MNEHDIPDPEHLGVATPDLDGHTIEELSDYLDARREPFDSAIEQSPGCRIALDALARLRELTPELFASDTAEEAQPDEEWVEGILAGIALDARAGRRIPFPAPASDADLGITEGAVRGVIRGAERAVPGVIVGKCWLDGDITVPGEPVRVRVDVSVPYGERIPDLAERLREEIAVRLEAHTAMNVAGIDVTVRDVQWSRDRRKGQ